MNRKIDAKPSCMRGKMVCRYDGGPYNDQSTQYQGKRQYVTMKFGDRKVLGAYRHETRPLGDRKGYAHVYVWQGGGWPTVPPRHRESKAMRREQRQRGRLAGRELRQMRQAA